MQATIRVKTIKVDFDAPHGYRKGQTVEVDGHPRSVVTRIKGNTIWMLPVPAIVNEAVSVTFGKRVLMSMRLLVTGKV
ncbi:hypothetical protein [uncultured Paludibaculum sp.]|uniref:hypothetical protein n=1 Tax=uncultured Paludibaculum sp. TaxID=1765020 RepID=UPI002AAAEB5F|nr:hypothetical protein [uncultured Paludibaculum sp.]